MSIVVGAAVAIGVKCSTFVPRMALGVMDCSLLGEACSRLLAVGASVVLVDNVLLLLPVAGIFVTFAFRSGDGNFFLLGWQMV